MRVALFGGSFNPIHVGHLTAAEAARESLRLDRVLFVPCRRPPHKPPDDLAPARDRLAMVRRAVRGHPAFAACDIEIRRPGPSYTVDTLETLRASMGSAARRKGRGTGGAALFLLLGADALADLPKWREARRVARLARVAAVGRPGWRLQTLRRPLARAFGRAFVEALDRRRIDAPRVDLASRHIRRRLRAGRSIRYLVPEAVERYIRDRGLYR